MSIAQPGKPDISSPVVGQAAPLHIQVYDHIWRALMAGELPAGTRLKDGTWAERLGVSRTPVREAILPRQADDVLDQLLAHVVFRMGLAGKDDLDRPVGRVDPLRQAFDVDERLQRRE